MIVLIRPSETNHPLRHPIVGAYGEGGRVTTSAWVA